MDIVYIRNLTTDTIIGIYPWERQVRQLVSLDVEMGYAIAQAARSDCIDHALNYKAIAKRLITFIQQSHCQLIETLAEQCAHIIRQEFHVAWLKLRLSKPGALRGAQDVGVIIERGEKL